MSEDKASTFFPLLDPANFDDITHLSGDLLIKSSCVLADCLHPCYGASHESSCNSCMNGFETYNRNKGNSNISADALEDLK
jgi:hypothetical protein